MRGHHGLNGNDNSCRKEGLRRNWSQISCVSRLPKGPSAPDNRSTNTTWPANSPRPEVLSGKHHQRLSQEGILLSRRNYGVFVVEVETHDLREINEVRESVESAAARRMLDAAPGRSKTPAKC